MKLDMENKIENKAKKLNLLIRISSNNDILILLYSMKCLIYCIFSPFTSLYSFLFADVLVSFHRNKIFCGNSRAYLHFVFFTFLITCSYDFINYYTTLFYYTRFTHK